MLVLEGYMFVLIHNLSVILGVPVLILNVLLCTAEVAPDNDKKVYDDFIDGKNNNNKIK